MTDQPQYFDTRTKNIARPTRTLGIAVGFLTLFIIAAGAGWYLFNKNEKSGMLVERDILSLSVMPGYVFETRGTSLVITANNPLPQAGGDLYQRIVHIEPSTILQIQEARKTPGVYAAEVAAFEVRTRELMQTEDTALGGNLSTVEYPSQYTYLPVTIDAFVPGTPVLVFTNANVITDEAFIAHKIEIPLPEQTQP